MRALVFRPGPVRRRIARALGPVSDLVRWGAAAGLAPGEVEEPPLPAPGWVRLEVLLAGVGLSELRDLTYAGSPLREPFSSWPAVPGREILGRVVEASPGWTGPAAGARVVVDPFLPCAARGWPDDPCTACARGRAWACARAGEEGRLEVAGRPLARGRRLGAHADLPGGWAPRVLAHGSQLVAVPDGLPDRVAVLLEPAARVLEAVVRSDAAALRGGPELVLGSTAEALLTVAVLEARGAGPVVLHAGSEAARSLARRLGAASTPADPEALRDETVAAGSSAYMSLDAREVWWGGGFRRVFDWRSLGGDAADAVTRARPGGAVVVGAGGGGGEAPELGVHRGVTLVGAGEHAPRAAFAPAAALLEARADLLREVVTHIYPLEQRGEALALAARPRDDAVKVLFLPGG